VQMARRGAGGEALVGALHCGKVLHGSVATRQVQRPCFLFVLSLKWCGATRQKIVLKREQMH